MLKSIRLSYQTSDNTYGSPRVYRDLQDAGHACSENRLARLLKAAGLKARHKRRHRPSQDEDIVHTIAPNLLDRQFEATAPNDKWAADFTYVWTAEGWLFVAVVLDLFSRRVVAWSMQPMMTSQLVMDALMMAVFRRGRPGTVLHHSDQGLQYTSESFQRLLELHGIVCSMSRCGNCWDNAAMESFFSTLKTERPSRRQYKLGIAPSRRLRLHRALLLSETPALTLGYISPVQYENSKSAQQEVSVKSWEAYDDTHRGSIIVTAQLPIEAWHGWIGEPTVGDAVIDRVVSGAHLIKLCGESMRKTRVKAK